jgi:hypothetical protein
MATTTVYFTGTLGFTTREVESDCMSRRLTNPSLWLTYQVRPPIERETDVASQWLTRKFF